MIEENVQQPKETGKRNFTFEIEIEKIKKLAEKFGIQPPLSLLKEDSHFWFLVLMIVEDRVRDIREILNSEGIGLLSAGLDQIDLTEDTIQYLAIESAMQIINAGSIDKLTNSWKRDSLEEKISFFQNLIKEQTEHEEFIIIFYFLDLDNFKQINDKFGHQMGDEVLKELIKTTKSYIRPEDSIFRYGGEEFAVLKFMNVASLKNTATKEGVDVHELIKKISNNFQQNVSSEISKKFKKLERRITLSMGVIQIDPHEDPQTAISRADGLMYQAKEAGKDQVFFQWDENKIKSFANKIKKIFTKSGKIG